MSESCLSISQLSFKRLRRIVEIAIDDLKSGAQLIKSRADGAAEIW